MTITVPGMRSNKLVSMDIDQLRGWATFMDRAMIVSLIATIMAVAALGITTWLSFRYSGAVRAHEHALVDRYKGMESHSVQVEQDVAAARERAVVLEQEVSTARGRAVALEQEVSAARERAVALEQEASRARERAAAFEQAAREATEQAARAARESADASEKARTPRFDAAEIKQRLADLGKLVREATARAVDPTQGSATETPRPVQVGGHSWKRRGKPRRAAVADRLEPAEICRHQSRRVCHRSNIRRSGHRLDHLCLSQRCRLGAADMEVDGRGRNLRRGRAHQGRQRPRDVRGRVHPRGGPALDRLQRDERRRRADWRRFRGALDGPQTPGPTEAPIRIVIGAKPR